MRTGWPTTRNNSEMFSSIVGLDNIFVTMNILYIRIDEYVKVLFLYCLTGILYFCPSKKGKGWVRSFKIEKFRMR